MNLIYHSIVGVSLYLIFDSKEMLISSILPDLTLGYNEIKLFLNKKRFDENEVDNISYTIYHLVHSLLFCFICFIINFDFGVGLLIHQICDWFTHTGRFSTIPLYPLLKWKIPFGRNILK